VTLRWTSTGAATTTTRRAAADALVRRTVASVHGAPAELVTVGRRCPRCGSTRHGAPVARVAGLDAPVSVAYAAGLAVVAVAEPVIEAGRGTAVLGVGVDVEPAHRPADGLDAVLAAPPGRAGGTGVVDAGTLTRWVRVEAVLKAARVGLAVDPADVVVEPPDRVLVPPAVDAVGWWVTDTAAVPGCVGALALRLAHPVTAGDVRVDAAPA
jgi:4'-phosphopantetheinyl transferase